MASEKNKKWIPVLRIPINPYEKKFDMFLFLKIITSFLCFFYNICRSSLYFCINTSDILTKYTYRN